MKTTVMSIRLEESVHRQIMAASERRGATAAEVVRIAISEYLERATGKGGLEERLADLESRLAQRIDTIPQAVLQHATAQAAQARRQQGG